MKKNCRYLFLYYLIFWSNQLFCQDSLVYKCVDNFGRVHFSTSRMEEVLQKDYSYLNLSCLNVDSFPSGSYPSIRFLDLAYANLKSYSLPLQFDNLIHLNVEECVLSVDVFEKEFISPQLEILLGNFSSEDIELVKFPSLKVLNKINWYFQSRYEELAVIEQLSHSTIKRLQLDVFDIPDDSFFSLPLSALSIAFVNEVDMSKVVEKLSMMPNLKELQIICNNCEIPNKMADLPFLDIFVGFDFLGNFINLPDSLLYGSRPHIISLPTKGTFPNIPKTKILISYFGNKKYRRKGWKVIDQYSFDNGIVD